MDLIGDVIYISFLRSMALMIKLITPTFYIIIFVLLLFHERTLECAIGVAWKHTLNTPAHTHTNRHRHRHTDTACHPCMCTHPLLSTYSELYQWSRL